MSEEIWRPLILQDQETSYIVSSHGSVRDENKKLCKFRVHGGYYTFIFKINGVKKELQIHRLVASTFIDNPNKFIYIQHLDGNPFNSRIDNLKWVSLVSKQRQTNDHVEHKLDVKSPDNVFGKRFSDMVYTTFEPHARNIPKERFYTSWLQHYEANDNDLTRMPVFNTPAKRNIAWVLVTSNAGIVQPIAFMTCVKCGEVKPRTCEYWGRAGVKGDFEKWFGSYGLPSFKTSCKMCAASQWAHECSSDLQTDNNFWSRMGALLGATCTTAALQAKWDKTLGTARARGGLFCYEVAYGLHFELLSLRANARLIVSPHDMAMAHRLTGEKYNSKHHHIDHIAFGCGLGNVPQRDHIEHLSFAQLDMYADVFKYSLLAYGEAQRVGEVYLKNVFLPKYYQSPKQNGVTASSSKNRAEYETQRYHRHPPIILSRMVARHKNGDRKAQRPVGDASIDGYLKILIDTKFVSAVTHTPLTFGEKKPTDVSFDRIDNSLPHSISNLRPVAILHQIMGRSGRVLTDKTYYHFALSQGWMKVPANSAVYHAVKARHDAMTAECYMCLLSDEGNQHAVLSTPQFPVIEWDWEPDYHAARAFFTQVQAGFDEVAQRHANELNSKLKEFRV